MAKELRQIVDQDWEDIQAWLPDDIDDLAVSTGALQRRRQIKSGSELLRIILGYSLLDYSLRSTSAWLSSIGLHQLSDVAILKRLKAAPAFLEALLKKMLGWRLSPQSGQPVSASLLNVRLIDATVISKPGSQGTDWRLHVTYNPAKSRIDNIQLTDKHGGENLARAEVMPGDLIVADRAYPQCERIIEVREAMAHVLVRMGHSSICIYDEKGKQIDVVEVAKKKYLPTGKTRIGHVLGWIHGKQDKREKVRIIIIRKAKDAAEKERRRIMTEAKKKGRQPMQRTLDAADFTFLLTTLEENQMSDTELADLYRVRWQIELAFKRLKSLIDLDQLRAKDPELTKTYLLGKMVAAVLLETIAEECRTISPWGLPLGREPLFVA